MVWGLLELFQTDGDPEWLRWARQLQTRQDDLFLDYEGGGWYSTTGDDSSVLLRTKDDSDGAEPSAVSVSVLNLLTLAHLNSDQASTGKIEAALTRLEGRLEHAMPLMAAALGAYHTGLSQIVIVGPADRFDTQSLKRCAASRYLPFAVQITVEPGLRQQRLAEELPFIGSLTMAEGNATAYVCTNFACQEPTSSVDRFDAQLAALHPRL